MNGFDVDGAAGPRRSHRGWIVHVEYEVLSPCTASRRPRWIVASCTASRRPRWIVACGFGMCLGRPEVVAITKLQEQEPASPSDHHADGDQAEDEGEGQAAGRGILDGVARLGVAVQAGARGVSVVQWCVQHDGPETRDTTCLRIATTSDHDDVPYRVGLLRLNCQLRCSCQHWTHQHGRRDVARWRHRLRAGGGRGGGRQGGAGGLGGGGLGDGPAHPAAADAAGLVGNHPEVFGFGAGSPDKQFPLVVSASAAIPVVPVLLRGRLPIEALGSR
mmetsp:Transcript_86433/g.231873  ORF Transcript_86433/g.231873 Transcript_86433/m.231873 type:complete len:275 (+) Transcript_86433:288-1112(+)